MLHEARRSPKSLSLPLTGIDAQQVAGNDTHYVCKGHVNQELGAMQLMRLANKRDSRIGRAKWDACE